MKYLFWTLGAALLITAVVFIWHPTTLYIYKGYTQTTIEQALQIKAERGNQDVIYDEASGTAYLTYDFVDTNQGDYGFTGVPQKHVSGWLIICGVFGFFSTALGFIKWDEARPDVKRSAPGKKRGAS
jgi:hypothetical protein